MVFAVVLYRADGRGRQYKLANRDRQIGLIVDERFVAGLRGGCAHDWDLETRLVDTVKHRHNSGTDWYSIVSGKGRYRRGGDGRLFGHQMDEGHAVRDRGGQGVRRSVLRGNIMCEGRLQG
ncbi:hypothetical protein CSHISOI_11138 [Colletotrichum shisoi]|uniref:Uncharacterized protein n=1 Tax=Colletotrichum shisoi TaxID=2078593 RepID=A0A5Q4BC58_9PEZI|nr:hypothetical protein CSHISOI_11138 [Colletotrichum shisoi]